MKTRNMKRKENEELSNRTKKCKIIKDKKNNNKRCEITDKDDRSEGEKNNKDDSDFIDDSYEDDSDFIDDSDEDDSSEDDDSYEDDSDFIDDENDKFEKNLMQLKKDDKEAYENFVNVKEEISKKTPNIIDILKTPIRLKDKAFIVELYEIYKTFHSSSEESLEMKHKINKLLKKYKKDFIEYKKYDKKKLDRIKELSTKLKSNISDFSLKNKILSLNTNEENKIYIFKRYKELKELDPSQEEYTKLKTWLKWATEIPHDNLKTLTFEPKNLTKFLREVATKLDNELYGMKKVKEQILLFLNSKLSNPDMKGCSLGFIGPPGTGKTSIAKSLAQILDFPFEQISFGGVSNTEFLKGHEFTYIGSRPGEIVRCLQRMKYKNGIMFFDEYDKVSDNRDIISSLLHITDPQQNDNFRDNYLVDISVDLSRLWFIYSMNALPEDSALRDRLFTIEVPGYNLSEKIHILKDFILPKNLKNIGRDSKDIIIDNDSASFLINKVTCNEDKGIRTIEKVIKEIINKINFLVNNQDKKGNLTGFDLTFKVDKKLTYPVKLDNELINILCEKIEKISPAVFSMYM